MANEITDAIDGLAALLATIPGLVVHKYPPDGINAQINAVIRLTARGTQEEMTLAGSSFRGRLTATLFVGPSLKETEAWRELVKYAEPLGEYSLEAATDADPTWGGKVDGGKLVLVDNFTNREEFGGRYPSADFSFEFMKQVLT